MCEPPFSSRDFMSYFQFHAIQLIGQALSKCHEAEYNLNNIEFNNMLFRLTT